MAYFVRIKGKAFGPFDEMQLLEMKSKGKITKSTEISSNSKDDWQSAETFPFLYEPVQVSHSGPQSSSNEPANWFYSLNGTEGYGPVTAMAIEQMLQSGQLNSNSYVWQQGQNARLIKNEPRFSSATGGVGGGGNSAVLPPTNYTGGGGNTANIGGEITGTTEQVDTGQMLRPIAASLGWLMFLKIAWLLNGVIVGGLILLLGGGYWISLAIGADAAWALLVVLMVLIFAGGLYGLQVKTFLCFWKYHTELYKTVATGRASDLIQANQSLYLFWKWLGIDTIACLAVALLYGITMALIIGLVTGGIAGIFG